MRDPNIKHYAPHNPEEMQQVTAAFDHHVSSSRLLVTCQGREHWALSNGCHASCM